MSLLLLPYDNELKHQRLYLEKNGHILTNLLLSIYLELNHY